MKESKKSKVYDGYIEEMEGVEEWNVQTCCYVLGSLGRDFVNGNLPENEWLELADMVPLSLEDRQKISW